MYRFAPDLSSLPGPQWVLALMLAAPAAHAEGLYVGGGGLLRHYDSSERGTDSGASSGTIASGRWFAGYEFDRHWGLETGFAGLGTPTTSSGNASSGGRAWFGAVRASWPLSPQTAVFGKLGLDRLRWRATGGSDTPSTKTSTAAYLGAGLQYRINDRLAATAELERFGAARHPGGPLTSISLNLRFDF